MVGCKLRQNVLIENSGCSIPRYPMPAVRSIERHILRPSRCISGASLIASNVMVQLLSSFTFNTAQASRQRFLPRTIFLFFFSLSQSICIFVSRIPQIIDSMLIIQSVSSTRCYLLRLCRSQCPRTIGSLPTAGGSREFPCNAIG